MPALPQLQSAPDRYSAYNWYPVRWRQLCWAHLLRDFAAMQSRGGASEELGVALLAQAHQMFAWWHRVREGTLKRSTFRSYMTPLRREVERLLEDRKSTRLNSSHLGISYAVFCLTKK